MYTGEFEEGGEVISHPRVGEGEQRAQQRHILLQQDFPIAVAAGAVASVVGAILWGWLSVATGYPLGFMALGIGVFVGLAVRHL